MIRIGLPTNTNLNNARLNLCYVLHIKIVSKCPNNEFIINTGGLYGANDGKKSLKIILISFRKQEGYTCLDGHLSTIVRTWTCQEVSSLRFKLFREYKP